MSHFYNVAMQDDYVKLAAASFKGNIVPHSWYQKIINSRGYQDTNSIMLLAEIVYWYRVSDNMTNDKSGLIQFSYDHLEKKLNLSRSQIRDAFTRLENLNLVKRIFSSKIIRGQIFSNVMYVDVNLHKVLEITTSEVCTRDAYTNIDTKVGEDLNFQTPLQKFPNPSSEISEYVYKEYIENNKEDLSLSACAKVESMNIERENNFIFEKESDSFDISKSIATNNNKPNKTLKKDSELQIKGLKFSFEEISRVWNRIINNNDEPLQLTASRIKALSLIFSKHFEGSIEKWEGYCKKIASSKFLMGEITPFKASFDWAIREENIVKVMEGNYGVGDRKFTEKDTDSNPNAKLNRTLVEKINYKIDEISITKRYYSLFDYKVENKNELILFYDNAWDAGNIKDDFKKYKEDIYSIITEEISGIEKIRLKYIDTGKILAPEYVKEIAKVDMVISKEEDYIKEKLKDTKVNISLLSENLELNKMFELEVLPKHFAK